MNEGKSCENKIVKIIFYYLLNEKRIDMWTTYSSMVFPFKVLKEQITSLIFNLICSKQNSDTENLFYYICLLPYKCFPPPRKICKKQILGINHQNYNNIQ